MTAINKSLSTPPSIKGVDFRLAVAVGVGSMMFAVILKMPTVLLFGWVAFYILKYVNRGDPMMMNILQSYVHQGSLYVPHSLYKNKRHDRPNGFGRERI